MTREEAIKTLKWYVEDAGINYTDFTEAFKMAIAALRPVSREQVEKVWRGEWMDTRENSKDVPTNMCSRCTRVVVGQKHNFCPSCGAPMTDDAVQMVMERLDVLEDDTVQA